MRDVQRTATLLGILTAALCGAFVVHAQGTAEPAFEVASIRLNTSGEPYVGAPGDRFADGRFRYTNVPLRLLIRQAFERWRSDDVRGGPGWLDTDRWDIDAKAESTTADMLPMIRSLLIDRFHLRHHIESDEGATYVLTFARPDRRLGSSLRPAKGPRTFRGGGWVDHGTGHLNCGSRQALERGSRAPGGRSHGSQSDLRRRSAVGTGQSGRRGTLGPSRLLRGRPGAVVAQTATRARPRGPVGHRRRRTAE
jgi:hypothetical protein